MITVQSIVHCISELASTAYTWSSCQPGLPGKCMLLHVSVHEHTYLRDRIQCINRINLVCFIPVGSHSAGSIPGAFPPPAFYRGIL